MAKLRAPAIAIMIQNICLELGQPFEPKTAPNMANGNAKTVCSNLIILRIIWNLEKILIMALALVKSSFNNVHSCIKTNIQGVLSPVQLKALSGFNPKWNIIRKRN